MTFSRARAGRPVGTARRPPAFGPAIWLGSPDAGYDCLLALTRAALRGGRWDEAEALLMKAAPIAQDDAAFCNLAGILWEARGNVRLARKFYGRAIAADGHYGPAQQNMRRLFELDRFGRTRQPAALGDEPVAR
jgi:tetratricopeptide (TPR) repeat protein